MNLIDLILQMLIGRAKEWAKNNLDAIRRWIRDGLSTHEIIRKINSLFS